MPILAPDNPSHGLGPFIGEDGDIFYENARPALFTSLQVGDGVVLVLLAKNGHSDAYEHGIPYIVTKVTDYEGWVSTVDPITDQQTVVEIYPAHLAQQRLSNPNLKPQAEVQAKAYVFRLCRFGLLRSSNPHLKLPNLVREFFCPSIVAFDAAVRKHFPKDFTAKYLGMCKHGKHIGVLWREKTGTMLHIEMTSLLISRSDSGSNISKVSDFFGSFGEKERTFFQPNVADHINGFLSQPHVSTNELLLSDWLPLLPHTFDREYSKCLRQSPRRSDYTDTIRPLPKNANYPLIRPPDELLLTVAKWCHLGAQARFRNVCRELRNKVPRPIIMHVHETMGLWDVQYATILA